MQALTGSHPVPMVVRAVLTAVLLAFLASMPLAVQATPTLDPAQPVAAVAITTGPSVIVTWIPGPEPADSFQVYGVTNGTLSPLTSAQPDQTSALLPADTPKFHEYAVTAWHDGIQTQATTTLLDLNDPCVAIYSIDPPEVFISNCLDGGPGPQVEIKT